MAQPAFEKKADWTIYVSKDLASCPDQAPVDGAAGTVIFLADRIPAMRRAPVVRNKSAWGHKVLAFLAPIAVFGVLSATGLSLEQIVGFEFLSGVLLVLLA